jgi:hypothetical protein
MLSPALNLVNDWQFVELWVDTTAIPPYVLMLLGDDQQNYCIFDPTQNYKIIFACSSYQEAKTWLLEDEYERVEGRLRVETFV